MKTYFISLIILFFTVSIGLAQTNYGDFTYEKKNINERKVVPYPPLREADVMKCNRIHRIIDTREKMNIVMNWPKNPLSKILYESITIGYGSAPIPAYTNTTDSLVSVMTAEELADKFSYETVTQYNPYPDEPDYWADTVIRDAMDPQIEILRYEIMEDWVFDKQRSMYFPRIIAVAPMYRPMVGGVKYDKWQKLCWIKWEDLRPILINQEVFNRHNDAMRISYLDFFEMRMFSSFITKENNAFDNYISDFEEFSTDKFAALLEAEKIKHKLFDWEHDLWEW